MLAKEELPPKSFKVKKKKKIICDQYKMRVFILDKQI